jgi:hypothetical protein
VWAAEFLRDHPELWRASKAREVAGENVHRDPLDLGPGGVRRK